MYKYIIKIINVACVCFKVLLFQSRFTVSILNLSISNHFNLTIRILVYSGLIEICLL